MASAPLNNPAGPGPASPASEADPASALESDPARADVPAPVGAILDEGPWDPHAPRGSILPAPPPSDPPPPHPGAGRWGKSTRHVEEGLFLDGPRARQFELARAVRIFFECIKGFRKLHFEGPCVTVFGSARIAPDDRYYQLAHDVAGRIGQLGFTIMTGGGPGIMEAANKGAKDVGVRSIGCNITLPTEQEPNPYLDEFIEFRYFFVRKVMLVKYSYAFVVMPGGLGTLDELFEALTLIQTGKIREFPVILMGKDFWAPLLKFFRDRLLSYGTISAEDLDLVFITDSPVEAVDHIAEHVVNKFGFSWGRPRKRWWLGE